jgi:hypothetical protein
MNFNLRGTLVADLGNLTRLVRLWVIYLGLSTWFRSYRHFSNLLILSHGIVLVQQQLMLLLLLLLLSDILLNDRNVMNNGLTGQIPAALGKLGNLKLL